LALAVHLQDLIGNVSRSENGRIQSARGLPVYWGLELSGHVHCTPWLGLGLRAVGGKMLTAWSFSEASGTSSRAGDVQTQLLSDAQWLWRISAEARFDPPLWPRGLWFSLEAGAAFAVDTIDESDGGVLRSRSATQAGPLVGLAVGWDLPLASALLLGFELRGQLLAFGSHPPLLSPGRSAEDFGTLPSAELGMRFGYLL
jgi:hypothetical protein